MLAVRAVEEGGGYRADEVDAAADTDAGAKVAEGEIAGEWSGVREMADSSLKVGADERKRGALGVVFCRRSTSGEVIRPGRDWWRREEELGAVATNEGGTKEAGCSNTSGGSPSPGMANEPLRVPGWL